MVSGPSSGPSTLIRQSPVLIRSECFPHLRFSHSYRRGKSTDFNSKSASSRRRGQLPSLPKSHKLQRCGRGDETAAFRPIGDETAVASTASSKKFCASAAVYHSDGHLRALASTATCGGWSNRLHDERSRIAGGRIDLCSYGNVRFPT